MKPRVKGGARARKVVLRRRHASYRGSGDRDIGKATSDRYKKSQPKQRGARLAHLEACTTTGEGVCAGDKAGGRRP